MPESIYREMLRNVKAICRKRKCRAFHLCHSPYTGENFQLISRCPQKDVSALVYGYKKRVQEFKANLEKERINLSAETAQELYRSLTESLGPETEICTHYFPGQGIKPPSDEMSAFDEIKHAYHESTKKPENFETQKTWMDEAKEFFFKNKLEQAQKNLNGANIISQFLASMTYNLPCGDFQASTLEAGKMSAILVPSFDKAEVCQNGWSISPKLRSSFIEQLNSGRIPIVTTHESEGDIRSHIGLVRKSWVDPNTGHLMVEGDVDDSQIGRILKREKVGISLRASGMAICSVCKKQVVAKERCPIHPKAPLIITKAKIRHVALVESPAFNRSKVVSYEEGND